MAAHIPKIIFQDESVIVVDKPAGMVVHPAGKIQNGTLSQWLTERYHLDKIFETIERPGIVHRLDRDTSGVMVVARTPVAADNLKEQFRTRKVHKKYLAIVVGQMENQSGKIIAAIGRSTRHRERMGIEPGAGRDSATDFRVVESFPGYSLLEVLPHTGRTHQIRVHLAHWGFPVAGDPVYGRKTEISFPRQMLHAWKIVFSHPRTKNRMEFEAPVAEDMSRVLNLLRSS